LSIGDFQLLGFKPENVSIQDIDSYRDNKIIKDMFTNEAGNFDESGFRNFYNNTVQNYNMLVAYKDIASSEITYDRMNVFAPTEQRKFTPNFNRVTVLNPTDINQGVGGLDYTSSPKQSIAEIAEGNDVLLNPVEVEKNGATPKWGKNPHDGFFDYFTDTLVLAKYDSEGDHKDPLTGQMVHHDKGELKTNEEGSYYYEKLDGRDAYGRDILYKANVLTKEGSWLNSLDFFDSDDVNKSTGGSIMKELVLAGSMFIPYVGTYIRALSVATQTAGLLATFGKMMTGSDNPTLSSIEAWTKSIHD
jgi:hypothetical protein